MTGEQILPNDLGGGWKLHSFYGSALVPWPLEILKVGVQLNGNSGRSGTKGSLLTPTRSLLSQLGGMEQWQQ